MMNKDLYLLSLLKRELRYHLDRVDDWEEKLKFPDLTEEDIEFIMGKLTYHHTLAGYVMEQLRDSI